MFTAAFVNEKIKNSRPIARISIFVSGLSILLCACDTSRWSRLAALVKNKLGVAISSCDIAQEGWLRGGIVLAKNERAQI